MIIVVRPARRGACTPLFETTCTQASPQYNAVRNSLLLSQKTVERGTGNV